MNQAEGRGRTPYRAGQLLGGLIMSRLWPDCLGVDLFQLADARARESAALVFVAMNS